MILLRGQHQGQPAQRTWNHEKIRTRSPRGTKNLVHPKASAKPVSSAVKLLSVVAPRNAGWRITRDLAKKDTNKVIRRDISNSHADHFGAVSWAFTNLHPWRVSSQETRFLTLQWWYGRKATWRIAFSTWTAGRQWAAAPLG